MLERMQKREARRVGPILMELVEKDSRAYLLTSHSAAAHVFGLRFLGDVGARAAKAFDEAVFAQIMRQLR